MVGIRAVGEDGIERDVCRVAAVVIDDREVLIAHGIHNALAVIAGELLRKAGGQQAGQRLCNHNAVRADRLVCLDVFDDELGALFEYDMHHIRLVVAVDERLGHIEQAARQREGADHAGKHRPVLNHAHDLFDRINIDLRAARADLRHRKRFRQLHALVLVHLGRDHRAGNRRHLVIREADGRAEALCFKRKIHQADRCARIGTVGNRLHAARLQIAVRNQVFYRNAQQLDRREGQHRHRLFGRGLEQVFCPLIHI